MLEQHNSLTVDDLNPGQWLQIMRFTNDMTALKWIRWTRRFQLSMLSTYHRSEMQTVQTHRGKKDKPAAIVTYNRGIPCQINTVTLHHDLRF